ncbi:hypothetical protein DEIGR_101597 [Deinococcus grandis]|uniref:Uncharacterized protein n=1 Tax=Deinococcus grandis TaxID=57498 RepID=A0A124BRL3_9DEIO|nr:hypothetical protein [Deinococcus grandis]BBN94933.1 hypothetical protein DEGR_16660 [Deinococcus grandis]GAQ21570.1 hypothetical protein DEIGR_101597 [Deinococcus grandis]
MNAPAPTARTRPAAPSPAWSVAGGLLGLGTLVAWAWLLFGVAGGVEVVNRSGEVLSGLRVCGPAGCVERARLWPHQSWRVPVDGEQATVQVGGAEVALGSLDRQATRVVVGEGGAVHTTTE